MEDLGLKSEPDESFWRGRRVLITGHTGFKGGWLTLWLNAMGAETHGFALGPPAGPNLFRAAAVAQGMAESIIGDVRDPARVFHVISQVEPEVISHLAAQPLVRDSYLDPVDTYTTNVMGVVHVLEAARLVPGVKAVVNVTTDKCYENKEWLWGYRESEPLGGRDPYSSSKACAELITAAYRESFLTEAGVAVASARAGNVIGGGDWAKDRLLTDVFLAVEGKIPLRVRAPEAIRPWQHVLEPVSGYLMLAERLCQVGTTFAEPWNFGPADDDLQTVRDIVEHMTRRHAGLVWESVESVQPHEAHALRLDSSKARTRLGWRPHWRLTKALDKTSEWHDAWRAGKDMNAYSLAQIGEYSRNDG
jgi:CDP-glucose 4,6-dehydratase